MFELIETMMAAPIPSPPLEASASLITQFEALDVDVDAVPLSLYDLRPSCLAAIVSDMNESLVFSLEDTIEPVYVINSQTCNLVI